MGTLNPGAELQGSLFSSEPGISPEYLLAHILQLESLIHKLTEHLIQLDLRIARLEGQTPEAG